MSVIPFFLHPAYGNISSSFYQHLQETIKPLNHQQSSVSHKVQKTLGEYNIQYMLKCKPHASLRRTYKLHLNMWKNPYTLALAAPHFMYLQQWDLGCNYLIKDFNVKLEFLTLYVKLSKQWATSHKIKC